MQTLKVIRGVWIGSESGQFNRFNATPRRVCPFMSEGLLNDDRHAAAALFLRLKGYRILARRFYVNGGQIDLIAQKFDAIAFVEVKIRPTLLEAMTAIDARKLRRMSRAASVWLAASPWAARLSLRGDAIYLVPSRWPHHAIAALPLDIG
jgi:putative endonuclease